MWFLLILTFLVSVASLVSTYVWYMHQNRDLRLPIPHRHEWYPPVDVALTQTVNLRYPPNTVDGFLCNMGTRILVMGQEIQEDNGIYEVVRPEVWHRSLDFEKPEDLREGAWVYVVRGTEYKGTCWSTHLSSGVSRPYVSFHPAWTALTPLKTDEQVYRMVSVGPHRIEWFPDPASAAQKENGEYLVTSRMMDDSRSTTRVKAWVLSGQVYWDDENSIKQGRKPPDPHKDEKATWERLV